MLNWREVPFIRLLIPFLTGILLAIFVDKPLPYGHFVLIISGIILLIAFKSKQYKYRFLFGWSLYVFLILFAFQLTSYNNDLNKSNHFSQFHDENNILLAQINDVPTEKKTIKLQTTILSTYIPDLGHKISQGKLLLYIPPDENSKKLKYGDIIVIHSKVNRIEAPKNPLAFDFQKNAAFQNIHYQSFAKEKDWTFLKNGEGNLILATAQKLRNQFLSILKKHLGSNNEQAVAAALILGYKNDLSESIRNAYAGTGAMHVLAVSGLHIGIVYLIIAFFMSFIKSKKVGWQIFKLLIQLFFVWGFALVTGAAPSVQRAATMFTFLIIGNSLNRYTNIYNTLAVAAFCMLCYNPYLIMNVGFQLSFLAVIGIVYFQSQIYAMWFIENKFGNYLWKMVSVSLAAQITTLPISLFYFHQFPIYFWLSGLVVVPAAVLILSGGLLLFFVDILLPIVSMPVAYFLYACIWIMNALIYSIEQLPGHLMTGLWIGGFTLILLYLVLSNIILALESKKTKWILSALSILLLVSINFAFTSFKKTSNKEITFYHSSQNTLIDFIDGNHIISFSNKDMSTKKINWAAKNYRLSNNIQSIEQFNFDNNSIEKNKLYYTNGFVQFYDKKLLILSQMPTEIPLQKVKLNAILIRDNPKLSIKKLNSFFEFEQIIFDASNYKNNIKKWKLECENLDLEYYDINEMGSFHLEVEEKY